MQMPRLVWGETSRERELRALVEGLQAERERKDRWTRVDREAYAAAMAAYVKKLEEAIVERDEARRERDAARVELKAACEERDEARGSRAALRFECFRSCQYRLRELIDRHDDVDRRLAEVSDAVASWRQIAEQILRSGVSWPPAPAANDIEPTDDSQEDRPATDSGAAEPRPPAKPLQTDPASTAARTIAVRTMVVHGQPVDLSYLTSEE